MRDDNCIFCKIANGEIPSITLFEDDEFRVIFDISPATYGHCLILPKEHAANVFELSEESASKVYVLAKKIATALKTLTACDGVNILQNNGEVAGQTVFHFHMHIIPRYENDKVALNWKHLEPDKEELSELAKKVVAIL